MEYYLNSFIHPLHSFSSTFNLNKLRFSKMYTLFAVFILSTMIFEPAVAGTFTKLNTTGTHPSERSSAVAAGLTPYVYLFGGVKDDYTNKVNTFYNDFYRLNVKTNTWEKLTPKGTVPTPRGFSAAVADNTNQLIWVFGGTTFSADFSDVKMFDELWNYSPSKNKWTLVRASNAGPGMRAKPNMWIVGDKIYIFGGASVKFDMYNDMWMYDIKANKWTLLIPNATAGSPPPRDESQSGNVATDDGKLIIYSGEGFSKGGFISYSDTWSYDIKTNKWQNVTPPLQNNILPARHFAVSAIIGNHMFVQGGMLEGVGATACVFPPFPQKGIGDDLWQFDSATPKWTKIGACGDAMPRLKRGTATAMDGKMYIFLGFDFQCYETNGPGQIWNLNDFTYDPGI